jgi:hypothetical protein
MLEPRLLGHPHAVLDLADQSATEAQLVQMVLCCSSLGGWG